jgi:transcriptional regulator with PAS, ATPase and Fis domain
MSRRVAGEEAETLASEAQDWIEKNIGLRYGWPGNYRELEQCVRNILIRKEYQSSPVKGRRRRSDIFAPAYSGDLTASELLSRYCTLIYSQTESYEEVARRLEIDRRTVKAKVNQDLLASLTVTRRAAGRHLA